jgi:hypothetical protein
MKKTRKSTTDMSDLVHGAGNLEVQLNQDADLYSDPDFTWDPVNKRIVLGASSTGFQLPDGFIVGGQPDLGGTGVGYHAQKYENPGTGTLNFDYVVPDGVDKIYLTGSGGGGGGGGTYGGQYGNGGGGAHAIYKQEVLVSPGQTIPVRIGGKGIGGAPSVSGTDGGSTVFNVGGAAAGVDVVTIPGGVGGGRAYTDGGYAGGPGGSDGSQVVYYGNNSGGGSIFAAPGNINSPPRNKAGGYGGGGHGGYVGSGAGGDGSGGFMIIEASTTGISAGQGSSGTIAGGSGNFVSKYLETDNVSQVNNVENVWGPGTYIVVVDNDSHDPDMDTLCVNYITIPDYLPAGSSVYGQAHDAGAGKGGGARYVEADSSFHTLDTGDDIVEILKFESFSAYSDLEYIKIDSSSDGALLQSNSVGGTEFITYSFSNFSGIGYNSEFVRGIFVDISGSISSSTDDRTLTVTATYPDGSTQEIWRYKDDPFSHDSYSAQKSDIVFVPVNKDQAAITITIASDGHSSTISAEVVGVQQTKTIAYDPNEFESVFAENGYQKLPNGLIMQWGKTPDLSGENNYTDTFPIAFPNACLSAQATVINSSTTNDDVFARIISHTTTQITIRPERPGTGAYSGPRNIHWFVIGH